MAKWWGDKSDGKNPPPSQKLITDAERTTYELVLADVFKDIDSFEFRRINENDMNLTVYTNTETFSKAERILGIVFGSKPELLMNENLPGAQQTQLKYKVKRAELEKIEKLVRQHPKTELPFSDENLAVFNSVRLHAFPPPVTTELHNISHDMRWQHPRIRLGEVAARDARAAEETTLKPNQRALLLVGLGNVFAFLDQNKGAVNPLKDDALRERLADILEQTYFVVQHQRDADRRSR